jgi:hypothetical protein
MRCGRAADTGRGDTGQGDLEAVIGEPECRHLRTGEHGLDNEGGSSGRGR